MTEPDEPTPFMVIPPTRGAAPVVVHVPHSATAMPDDVRAQLLLPDAELDEELRRMTDHRTEALADGVGEHGATRMVNSWSRLAVDPERFLDPAEEEMETVGMGAIYTRTSDGRVLRDPTQEQRQTLLDRHFHPYHAALTALVDEHLTRHGRCVIVDLHSYPRQALPYELHATGPRPEVDIGTDPRHSPAWLREMVVDVVTNAGFAYAENSPFAGTFVPGRHLGDERVSSVMLEIRRDTYLDEATALPHDGETRVRSLVTRLVERLATTGNGRS